MHSILMCCICKTFDDFFGFILYAYVFTKCAFFFFFLTNNPEKNFYRVRKKTRQNCAECNQLIISYPFFVTFFTILWTQFRIRVFKPFRIKRINRVNKNLTNCIIWMGGDFPILLLLMLMLMPPSLPPQIPIILVIAEFVIVVHELNYNTIKWNNPSER